MTFAEKLRELRLAKNIPQKELAKLAETTQQAIARWEAGLRVPAVDSFQRLCVALGVKCTAFDGVSYEANEEARPVGRPTKEAEAKPSPKKKKNKKTEPK